jgi:hypothetical protein
MAGEDGRAVDHGQRRSDFRNEGLSRGRPCDAARCPVEEAHVEAVLQPGNRVAERRGRRVEFARRPRTTSGAAGSTIVEMTMADFQGSLSLLTD